MTYPLIKAMMNDIRKEIQWLQNRLSYDGKEDTIKACMYDFVIFNYFWNYETDMPTCDCDLMEKAIRNTVKRILENS